MTGQHTDDPARELRRVVDRCAGYPLARWSHRLSDGSTPADLVHSTCQRLADLAALREGQPQRTVPRLRPHGLADQVSVLTSDALTAASELSDEIAGLLAELRRGL